MTKKMDPELVIPALHDILKFENSLKMKSPAHCLRITELLFISPECQITMQNYSNFIQHNPRNEMEMTI